MKARIPEKKDKRARIQTVIEPYNKDCHITTNY